MNTEKRRDCCFVIKQMLDKIPTDKEEFIKDLEWNFNDASYKAPEEVIQWVRTMETLMKHIPNPTENWEFEVLSIFTTRSIDELKLADELLKELKNE